MTMPGASGDEVSSAESTVNAFKRTERRLHTLEAEGELDIIQLFGPLIEEISPMFAAGEADFVGYGAGITRKRGHEIRPGEFVETEIAYRVEIVREAATITEVEEDEDPATDHGSGESSGAVGLLEDADEDEEYGAPNQIVVSIMCSEEVSHEVAEVPKPLMDIAEQNGWLRHDGKDQFFMYVTNAYILFLSDDAIVRNQIVQYRVNGETLGVPADLDRQATAGIMTITELNGAEHSTVTGLADNKEEQAWAEELGIEVDLEIQAAQHLSVASLSRQFRTQYRQVEYAQHAADIIWQVLRIPVPGFTDEQTPDRL